MPFDAETTCKSLGARVTSLENALKAQAENKVSSKMEALDKTITALKAADARDSDTIKALKAQSEKQTQSLEAAMKKKDALSVDQKALDDLKAKNDLKLEQLQKSLDEGDKAQRAAFEGLLKAELAKSRAEQNAKWDAERKQSETNANQGRADADKRTAEALQKQQANTEKAIAESQKAVEKQIAQIDVARLEARLKVLEALAKT